MRAGEGGGGESGSTLLSKYGGGDPGNHLDITAALKNHSDTDENNCDGRKIGDGQKKTLANTTTAGTLIK
jgi:hypothetical protein